MWERQELLSALSIDHPTSFVPVVPITGVSIDTRTLKAGDLFVALQGRHHDAQIFVHHALSLGAAGAIVEQGTTQSNTASVSNTQKALCSLGHAARKRYTGLVFAVTGSTGKTTVKEGLNHVLCQQSRCFAAPGSFNNQLGVSVSLSNLPIDAHWGIFELGMNRSGEIQDLARSVQPHVAMVTNVSHQHCENFENLDKIFQEKASIFSAPSVHTAVFCRDCPSFSTVKKTISFYKIKKRITFGFHPESTVRLVSFERDLNGWATVHVRIANKDLLYTIPFLGHHWVMNSVAILAGVLALNGCVVKASRDLSSFMPPPGRGQLLSIGGITVMDSSYNAAPAAMEHALDFFAHYPAKGKKHILLGEMKELGIHAKEKHTALIPLIHRSCDFAWLCGPAFQDILPHIHTPHRHAMSVHALLKPLLNALCPGDVLLVKGARSMETFAAIYALYKMYAKKGAAESYPLTVYLSLDTRHWIDKHWKETS